MSARVHPITDVVRTCVARQDGAWMVVTHKGATAVSLEKLPEGARVVIQDGRAVRSA